MEIAAKAASVNEARRDFVEEGFFEYHLYTLDGRTTLKNQQTKQLALLTRRRRAGRQAPDLLRRPGLLPQHLRHADLESEGRGVCSR